MQREKITTINQIDSINTTINSCKDSLDDKSILNLNNKKTQLLQKIDQDLKTLLDNWPQTKERYQQESFTYNIRNKDIKVSACFESIAQEKYPKVFLPEYTSKAEIARFLLKENLPGSFPFTSGIFPFRRQAEDPKRQFAGEGGPKRTNKRFNFLAKNDRAKRLSTAFDSVTLYGDNPTYRPDVFGKVGESGVSIASLADMKDLFAGFNLCDPLTSVSMTINGPAPVILAMYLNAAIEQQVAIFTQENTELQMIVNTKKFTHRLYM